MTKKETIGIKLKNKFNKEMELDGVDTVLRTAKKLPGFKELWSKLKTSKSQKMPKSRAI